MPGVLICELPCIDCGYLLRGLATDGDCPECGAAVRRSMQGDALWFANPRWIAKMRLAAVVLLAWQILSGGFILVENLIYQYSPSSFYDNATFGYSVQIAWLAIFAASFAGLLLLAQREPRSAGIATSWDVNRWLTSAVIALAALMVALIMSDWLTESVWLFTWFAFDCINLFALLCALVLLRRFAKRMRARVLATATVVVMSFATLHSLLSVTWIIAYAADYSFAWAMTEASQCLNIPVYIAFICMLIAYVVRLTQSLRRSRALQAEGDVNAIGRGAS